jgi:hypothetical protein
VFAFAGVTLAALTGDGRWDGAGSLGIGVLLATAAAILAVETKSLLIGESASTEMQRMILTAIEEGPEIMCVIHLRTVHIGPDSLLVTAKVAVRETDSAVQITAGIDAAEQRVRAVVPIARTIYLEPDIYRPSLADRTDPSIQAVLHSRTPHTPRASRTLRTSRPPRHDRTKPPGNPDSPGDPDGPGNPQSPGNPQDHQNPGEPEGTPGPGGSSGSNADKPENPQSPALSAASR